MQSDAAKAAPLMRALEAFRYRMDNEKIVKSWQGSIVLECENRLGRKLTTNEVTFITVREGFIALEIIEDTVKSLDGDELVKYLNSESNQNDYNGRD